MSELPLGWSRSQLQDIIADYQPGFASGKKNVANGLHHLRMNNISVDGRLNLELVRKVPPSLASQRHFLNIGDVLVCTTNSGKLVGKCARFDIQGEFVFSNHLTKLRPTSQVDSKYLHYQLWLQWKEGAFENKCKHWVNQSTLPKAELLSTEILLAPLNEQRRIVAKLETLLSRVNAAQERLTTIPHILKRFRQSVLSAACSGQLTADWRRANLGIEDGKDLLSRIRRSILDRYGRECELAKEIGNRKPARPAVLLDLSPDPSNLPDVPDTWSWTYLQNVGEFTRGKSKHRPRNDPKLFGGPYPFIQTGNVARSNRRILSHTQTYNELGLAQSRLFPSGTLCITIAANIAETALLTYPACFPDSVVGFIPEDDLFEASWAMYFMRVVQNDLETFAPATAQKNINMDILFKVAVPVPPIAEQQEIVRRVEALFKMADALEARYLKAKDYVEKLTQSILAKAFRGELVPQDPNDEPGSALLKRIEHDRNGNESTNGRTQVTAT